MIFVGVLSILALYTLRQDVAGVAGADNGALVTAWSDREQSRMQPVQTAHRPHRHHPGLPTPSFQS